MQSKALAHMTIPEKAIQVNKTHEVLKYHQYSFDAPFSYARYIAVDTVTLLGIPSIVLADILFPAFMFDTGGGIAITVVSYMGLFTTGLFSLIMIPEKGKMFNRMRNQMKPLPKDPWSYKSHPKGNALKSDRYSSRYYDVSPSEYATNQDEVISSKYQKNLKMAYFNPMRLFRKLLLSETIEYNLYKDTYTRTSGYLGAFRYTQTVEEFHGQRKSFEKTLTALERNS